MCSTCCRLGDSYLHATHSHAQGGRSALLTLLHLPSSLLLRGIVSVLSGPHLQIKHTGKLEVMHHVLQQEELWERRQGELNWQRRCSPGQPGRGTRREIGLGGKQIGTKEEREQTVWEGEEKGQNPSSGTRALAPCRKSQPGKWPAQHQAGDHIQARCAQQEEPRSRMPTSEKTQYARKNWWYVKGELSLHRSAI